MIHKNIKAFTLVELMVALAIGALIAGYAWNVYFNSSETVRNTVAQTQIQSDVRIFLDQLETEMMSCYAFDKVIPEKKYFSFYSFTYGKVPLDALYYDNYTGNLLPKEQQKLKVKKLEYYCSEEGKVVKKRTPGWLYFLKKPMEFSEAAPSSREFDPEDSKMTKEVLKDMTDFEIKGYNQKADLESEYGAKFTPSSNNATDTTFIVLRLHSYKDEVGKRRDEELDIVTKFYSSIKLADAASPGYFSSTDSDGDY